VAERGRNVARVLQRSPLPKLDKIKRPVLAGKRNDGFRDRDCGKLPSLGMDPADSPDRSLKMHKKQTCLEHDGRTREAGVPVGQSVGKRVEPSLQTLR
jgi:hypothetical protein